MPTFRLNLIADTVVRDDEGQDVRDLAAAIGLAIEGARELIADRIVSGEAVHLRHRIEVEDADGRVVHALAFADVLKIVA